MILRPRGRLERTLLLAPASENTHGLPCRNPLCHARDKSSQHCDYDRVLPWALAVLLHRKQMVPDGRLFLRCLYVVTDIVAKRGCRVVGEADPLWRRARFAILGVVCAYHKRGCVFPEYVGLKPTYE